MPIPVDFKDLITDFAREVLRCQPENIYEFGAQYFAAMDEEGLEQHQQKPVAQTLEQSNHSQPQVLVNDLSPLTDPSKQASEYVNELMERTTSKDKKGGEEDEEDEEN